MGGVRVPEGVWSYAFVDPRLPRSQAHGVPDDLARDRCVGPPAFARTGEEIGLRPHPAVVLAQGREERRTEGDVAIAAALALVDPEHHALAIDVAHLQMTHLAAAQAGTIEREEQRAVIEVLRVRDEPLHLVRAEDDR